MGRILWVVLGIVGYLVITKWWELLLERVRPFQIRGVKCEELKTHFRELCRRGLDGTEMVVTAEGGGATLVVRKELVGAEGIWLCLILRDVRPATVRASSFRCAPGTRPDGD